MVSWRASFLLWDVMSSRSVSIGSPYGVMVVRSGSLSLVLVVSLVINGEVIGRGAVVGRVVLVGGVAFGLVGGGGVGPVSGAGGSEVFMVDCCWRCCWSSCCLWSMGLWRRWYIIALLM